MDSEEEGGAVKKNASVVRCVRMAGRRESGKLV